ncbi:EutN/CcmL family microcompartment protein [Brevibacterium sp. FAM 27836]|uniref:EutN/CcmL family microcompartment protein n=1 Tax=Brevibacterium sp. FAM 27836 TaxID=3446693 RepID=UPI003F518617
MDLAIVKGKVASTVKESVLNGHRLALVQIVDLQGNPQGKPEVALDVTSAASGQMVLLARGSAARMTSATRQLPADLTVVAIVDEISPEKG